MADIQFIGHEQILIGSETPFHDFHVLECLRCRQGGKVKVKGNTLTFNSAVADFRQNKRVSALTPILCAGNRKIYCGRKGVADVRFQEHASNTLPCLAIEKIFHDLDADVGYKESGTCRSTLHCLSCLAIANIPLNCRTATAHPLQGWI